MRLITFITCEYTVHRSDFSDNDMHGNDTIILYKSAVKRNDKTDAVYTGYNVVENISINTYIIEYKVET
jgi:hypothetical protein